MIELKHISANTLVSYNDYKIRELMEKTGAESVEDILNLISMYPQYNWDEVYERLDGYVMKKLKLSNERKYEPQIFFTKGYSDEQLLHQDTLNNGDILLLNNPIDHRVRYYSLKPRTIKKIKTDLSHTFSNGNNYIASNNSYRNIGMDSIPTILSAIEMYEEQIGRQSLLTSARDINLFELHQKEKLDIAEEMYNEIIMYLLYHTEERLAWGKLTDASKKIYLSTAINKTPETIERRQKIKEHIANYTTLPELEKVANHNLKVLKRFIVK